MKTPTSDFLTLTNGNQFDAGSILGLMEILCEWKQQIGVLHELLQLARMSKAERLKHETRFFYVDDQITYGLIVSYDDMNLNLSSCAVDFYKSAITETGELLNPIDESYGEYPKLYAAINSMLEEADKPKENLIFFTVYE